LLKEQGAMTDLELKKAIPSAKKWLPVMKDEGEILFEERQVCRNPFGEVFFADSPPEKLFLEQQKALDEVAAALDKGMFETFLLHGVTGSGKTEVYLQAVDRVLKKGGNALILVPEIALITQMEQRVRARFGDRVAVLHSGLTPGERLDQWMRIHKGEAPVTVGARSGIFAPYKDLSLIVVDEEHDESYKQDGHLRYNARDLAVLRARMNNAVALLGSATPSLTSRHNVTRHKFTGLEIKSRIEERPFPKIEVVDLKQVKASKTSLVSPALRQALEETLSRGEQALVFLNRRGFANLPLCADCGQPLVCEQCDIALTYHQQEKLCLCHYCGFKKALPTPCQACGSPALRMVGTGTQKVEQYLLRCFPKANIARLDRDAAASRSSLIDILKGLKDKSLDIVVGTQMITKGHDFPNVTLVGILCADLSLGFPDFKASERTFQILCQVSGRAGRGENPGSVILQTYNPEHFCITLAQKNDYNSFYKAEMTHRRELGYPPYARLAQIRISGQDPGSTAALAKDAGNLCRSLCLKSPGIQKSVIVLGPIVSPIARIAGRFRWQILLKGLNTTLFRTYLAALAQALPALSSSKKAQAVIDVDPVSML
ncbi:MAG: primosomal protein N', partial [Desulfatibacillaceae bacterium]|nr:primosomal protein N' [Desulfatibacillaceae bacterium]